MRLHNPQHLILRRLHSVIMSAIRWASSALGSRGTRGASSLSSRLEVAREATESAGAAEANPYVLVGTTRRLCPLTIGLFAEQRKRRKPPTLFCKAPVTIARTKRYLSRKKYVMIRK